MMKWLQKLGKALMLPVAALPVCGILMGIGYALAPAVMGAEGPTTVSYTHLVDLQPDLQRLLHAAGRYYDHHCRGAAEQLGRSLVQQHHGNGRCV